MQRLIFHVDVNSAFLSWEASRQVRNGLPDLRKIPAIVGGDPKKRTSVVLAKSIPAKKYGIQTGEPVALAVRKCPDVKIVPSDFRLYAECSKAFKNICREYAPVVEEFSIDECFLDMSGTELIYPDPIALAHEMKDRIRDELGFTVNIGIAHNKMLAKMASDFTKPDRVHTLFEDELPSKFHPLPVGDLFLCGEASSAKLIQNHIRTIGDLANADLRYVQRILGNKLGQQLYDYANGIDDSPVSSEPEAPKGYSNEVSFEDDVTTLEMGCRVMMFLADSVASRVRKDGVRGRTVVVTIRANDMKRHSHQRNLGTATNVTSEIYAAACELLDEVWGSKRTGLRLLGLALTDLAGPESDAVEQLSFFTAPETFDFARREKEQKADQAVDAIRAKFGRDMIQRGSMLGQNISVGRKQKDAEGTE